MDMVKITISGDPVSKARPRATVVNGRASMYTPKKSKNFEFLIRQRAEKVFLSPLEGPVCVKVLFYLSRPKRLVWKTKPMPACPCDKRPDIDNIFKSVADGLNGVAFLDDGQIAEVHLKKMYHAGGSGPSTEIEITRL